MAWIKDRMIADGQIGTDKLTVPPVLAILTASAEASNAIPIAIQLKDADGNNVSRAARLHCEVLDDNMLRAATADFRLTETGSGTIVSQASKAGLLIETSSAGVATLSISDVSTVYAGAMWVKVTPVGTLGSPSMIKVTFA